MAGVDAEIKGVLIGVAKTGSWAVWNGVFERSWIKLLRAAGLNYHRARKVTGQLAAVISEERVLVAKVRHEREGRAGKEERDRRSEEAVKGQVRPESTPAPFPRYVDPAVPAGVLGWRVV
jgi:hypothetical protein